VDRRPPLERRRVWPGSQPAGFRGAVRAVGLPLEGAHSPAALAAHGPARGKFCMRAIATAAIAIVSLLPSLAFAGNKLSVEDRIELTRGLMPSMAP